MYMTTITAVLRMYMQPLCNPALPDYSYIHLFEGDNDRRVIKKDWGLEVLCEIFGIILAHSIIQGGPGFSSILQTEMIDEEHCNT